MTWRELRGPDALRLLAFLRRAPSRRPAQQPVLTVVIGGPEAPGSLPAPATVNRILAVVSNFYDWMVAAEEYDGDSPMQKRLDRALAQVPDRHQPFVGRASPQQPTRRTVTVKQPRRLPRPVDEAVLEQLLGSLKRLRDMSTPSNARVTGARRSPVQAAGLSAQDLFAHARGLSAASAQRPTTSPCSCRARRRGERKVRGFHVQCSPAHWYDACRTQAAPW
ncbi:hypothetical protein [Streptomyces sp. CoH27]|uniref:hypothetical protein n=1 Tax=Streptomyces sp. CoH27 TaxID=2875763 RepID=UPI001CD790F9|nr:hypothetical protein [Streptomyces sp. CoH27]